jgi:lysophospholipase L1-like esterase
MPVVLVTKEDYNQTMKNHQAQSDLNNSKQNFRQNRRFDSRTPFVNHLVEPKFKQRTFETTNRHIEFLKKSKPKTMFLGDSMFEKFKTTGKTFWSKNQFNKKEIFNAGIGGDKLENILYRIEVMDLFKFIDHLDNVIIFVGTNNLERDQPRNMIEALKKIISLTKQAFPYAKVTVFGLLGFVSCETGDVNIITRKTLEFNNLVSKLDGINYVCFRDKVCENDMPSSKYFVDHAHLNETGYEMFSTECALLI